MTLAELIEKAKPNARSIPGLAEDVLSVVLDHWESWVDTDDRLTSAYVQVWYCTDTWVGVEAYYLDGEPVFITKQAGRKCDTFCEFASLEAHQKVRVYVENLIADSGSEEPPSLYAPNQEMPAGYSLTYTSQVIPPVHKTGVHTTSGRRFVSTRCLHPRPYLHKSVLVTFEDGVEESVDLWDVLFDYAQGVE